MDDDAMSCSFAISNHVWASGLCLIKMWQQLKQSYTDKPNIYIQDCGGSAVESVCSPTLSFRTESPPTVIATAFKALQRAK